MTGHCSCLGKSGQHLRPGKRERRRAGHEWWERVTRLWRDLISRRREGLRRVTMCPTCIVSERRCC